MGLPLFVAPVESDVPAQVGDKSAAARQARSSIRRARRNVDSRPFRRRAALLRDNFPTPGPDTYITPAPYPWIESGHPPPPEAYGTGAAPPPPPPRQRSEVDRGASAGADGQLHDALREMRRVTQATTARLVSDFGDRWVLTSSLPGNEDTAWQEPERPQIDSFAAYADFAERRRFRRAQLDRMSMVYLPCKALYVPAPPVAARFDRSPEHSTAARFSSRRSRGESRAARLASANGSQRPSPFAPNRYDGLGDRSRSLSPDDDGVWHTLLTTLTPDPQPPSAGSSFASASASATASASQSQSAGASSHTSLTGPDAAEESLEQPCESGVDNSDSEGQEDLHLGRDWPEHWTTNYPSRYRRFVSNLEPHDLDEIFYVRPDGSRTMADQLRRAHQRVELSRRSRVGSSNPAAPTNPSDDAARDSSEESRGAGGPGDGDIASSGHSQTPNDNALNGMQMIVRNLARREDIPDEWWAGAGLSRTPPEDS
ncbi:hypothetical protein CCHL11_06414 [Colletotrichum chlorophyti]|uniref:Uncharacterized protein n=1 Tax=Colletotrichum chlorophyti TaxID=708187 RepID=A0A1Q8RQ68_9PEZI|nr:hypothetical protein CCHL11_06414 [Colletotrichum chlorophyti]